MILVVAVVVVVVVIVVVVAVVVVVVAIAIVVVVAFAVKGHLKGPFNCDVFNVLRSRDLSFFDNLPR